MNFADIAEYWWKFWLAFTVFGFAIPEYLGLRTKDTLSHWMVRWFNTTDGWSIERFILLLITIGLLAVAIWLVGHWVWPKLTGWGWSGSWWNEK
tara:strand:+ start:114 stop:395 length:282 start_codon:yes stop_codon:yes gene_type:complete